MVIKCWCCIHTYAVIIAFHHNTNHKTSLTVSHEKTFTCWDTVHAVNGKVKMITVMMPERTQTSQTTDLIQPAVNMYTVCGAHMHYVHHYKDTKLNQ